MSTSNTVTLSVQELCKRANGQLQGDGGTLICGVSALEDSHPSLVTFIKDPHFAVVQRSLADSNAGAYFVSDALLGKINAETKNLIFVKDPQAALFNLIPLFRRFHIPAKGVSDKADIHPSAKIGKDVSIAAFCTVGPRAIIGDKTVLHPHVCVYHDAKIGSECVIHAGAVIREDSHVGNNSVVQPGAVIGSDGFGYVPDPALGLRPIPQVGGVRLADFVDVGANSCIDRAALGDTVIGRGTKLDNLVQVGHNVKIGQNSILCGQVGIGGSSVIGDRVVLAGNAGVADHMRICSDVRLAAKSGVTTVIEEPGDYAGMPVLPLSIWLRNAVLFRRLPDLLKDKLVKKKKE